MTWTSVRLIKLSEIKRLTSDQAEPLLKSTFLIDPEGFEVHPMVWRGVVERIEAMVEALDEKGHSKRSLVLAFQLATACRYDTLAAWPVLAFSHDLAVASLACQGARYAMTVLHFLARATQRDVDPRWGEALRDGLPELLRGGLNNEELKELDDDAWRELVQGKEASDPELGQTLYLRAVRQWFAAITTDEQGERESPLLVNCDQERGNG